MMQLDVSFHPYSNELLHLQTTNSIAEKKTYLFFFTEFEFSFSKTHIISINRLNNFFFDFLPFR